MWWVFAYALLIVCAGVAFAVSIQRQRLSLGMGTLLFFAGAQLGLQSMIPAVIALAVATWGALFVAREAFAVIVRRPAACRIAEKRPNWPDDPRPGLDEELAPV